MLFHLLGASQPIANFTLASQTVNESDGVWADWPVAYSAWTKRREVRIDGVTGALSNFPVMIKLDSTRIDYAETQSAGQDLRFTDNAGTALSYEIESWDEAGTSIAWVKIPTLSAYPTTNSIWMYYGNAAAADAQAKTAVWDASHAGVWHFAGGATDSTSNAKNGTATGVSYVSGLAGQALSLNGTTGNTVQPPNSMLASVVFTVGAWFKTTANGVIVGHSNVAYSGGPGSWDPLLYVGTDGKLRGGTYSSGNPNLISAQAVNDGQWHYATLTGNTNTQSLYLDGVLQTTYGGALSMASMIYNYIGMGYWSGWPSTSGSWSTFNGQIDEVQISTSVRSADWIAATYASAADSLAVFGAEQTQTSGAALVTVQLNTPATTTITIPYTVSGTATAGTDHSRVSGNLTINGGSSSGSLNTYVLRDNLVEGSETAILTLGAPTGASLGPDTVHTVTITDEPLSPPDAVDDALTLNSLSAVTIPVLSNDTDANGDTLKITAISSPTAGTAVRFGQTIRYTPSGDFGATDSFTYTISDGRGGTDTATVTLNYQVPFTWIGSGADTNWSTAGNWLGGVAPGVGNTVYFNNQCSAQCNPTFTANASVLGIRLNSSYTGTIAQNAAYTITTATGGWNQKAGTFTGAAANVTVGGNFVLTGGGFTAPSTTLAINSGNFTVSGPATFAANAGLLTFGCGYGMTCVITPGSATYNNVTFAGFYAVYTLGGATMTIAGNLSMGDTYGPGYEGQPIDNGTLNVGGNVSIINRGNKGSAIVRLTGNASGQTVTGQTGLYMPGLTIDTGSNTVTLVGNLNVSSHYTYVSSGTFTVTGNTLGLWCAYGATCNITPGTVAYNNVAFSGYYTTINLGGGTMTIDGNLSFGDTYGAGYTAQPLNNGTLNVKGNIAVTSWGFRGTAIINALGGTGTTLGQPATAGFPAGTFTVNKNSVTDTMSLTSAITLYGTGQAMTITRGTVNLAGYNLTVPGALTVAANGKLICNGGTVTAGSTSIVGEMSCGPTLGITWTGLAGDGLWSTAGNWTNNTIPGASDIAYFNGSCTNCNATVSSAISVKGIVMASSYTGTLTQSNTMTVGTSGWSQAAGTFVGGSSDITIGGNFALSGGTFTSTSAVLILNRNLSVSGAPTFNHNLGTLRFYSTTTGTTVAPSTLTYNHVDFNGYDTTFDLGAATMTIAGNLQLKDRGGSINMAVINNGTLSVAGDLTASLNGYSGTSLVRLSGNAAGQTISSATMISRYPHLQISAGANNVTFSGNVVVSKNYTMTSVGTLTTTGSTLVFWTPNGGGTQTVVTGTPLYNNVTFLGYDATWNLSSGTLNVGGLLTLTDTGNCCYRQVNSGTINAYGDVTLSGNLQAGSAALRIVGSTNQSITGVNTGFYPAFEVASTGGVVSYVGTLQFGRNYTYTSGTVDAGTSTVRFYNNATTTTIVPGAAVNYNNVTFAGTSANFNVSGTMTVNGSFTFGDSVDSGYSINTGTILAYGSVVANNFGYQGSATIRVVGSTNQAITGVTTARVPNLEIASTGGTVSYSGTLFLLQNYTYTSGTVAAGTSTLRFWRSISPGVYTPGSIVHNDVTFAGSTGTYSIVGTMLVSGVLTLSDQASAAGQINTGTLSARGNVVYSSFGYGGSAPLMLEGSTSSTITVGASAARMSGLVTINKSGGSQVTFASTVSYGATGQDLVVAGGTLNLGGYDLTVNDVLTVDPGATLRCSGGVFTSATLSNSGTVNCPGFGGYEFNWTGAGGDSNWSTAANWAGGVAPSSTSVVVFNDTYCGANCNSTIATSAGVKGIQMQSPYTGTVTQASGAALTVGTRGWTQAAGTFTGSNAAIANAGVFALSGGTFTAPSSTVSVDGAYTVSGTGTFTAGTSTLQFAGSGTRTIAPGTGTYNNVTFPDQTLCYGYSLGGATMKVGGLLTISTRSHCGPVPPIDNGTIEAYGDVIAGTHGAIGTASIVLKGNVAGQTVTGVTGASIPNLQIAAGANNVTLSGTIDVFGSYTVTSVGTLTLTGTTLRFVGTGAATIAPGTHMYNNVSIPFLNACNSWNLGGGTLNVGGALVVAGSGWCSGIARALDNGTVKAYGSVDLSQAYQGGTGVILVAGNSGGQTVTGGATSQVSKLNFDTGSYAATLSGAVKATTSSNVATGSVALANSSSSFNTLALTLNGRTFTKNGGALTVNSVLAGTGSLFGGTVAP